MYLSTRLAVSVLDSIVDKGVIARIKGKHMTNVEKIMQAIASMEQPVTLKQLQDATELKPGILSGTLFSLTKQGKLSREKIERSGKMGPEMKWVYKIVANSQQAS